jgi:hypothetical protein
VALADAVTTTPQIVNPLTVAVAKAIYVVTIFIIYVNNLFIFLNILLAKW